MYLERVMRLSASSNQGMPAKQVLRLAAVCKRRHTNDHI